MDLKEKLADAHNNFPIIESHPAVLYAESLNRIIELELAIAEFRDNPITANKRALFELLNA